jgi:hypothetical protein
MLYYTSINHAILCSLTRGVVTHIYGEAFGMFTSLVPPITHGGCEMVVYRRCVAPGRRTTHPDAHIDEAQAQLECKPGQS